jgi:hypothetical protein
MSKNIKECGAQLLCLKSILDPLPPAWTRTIRRHSELGRNLLIQLRGDFARLSERLLILQEILSDFDSAIPWFESRRPSHNINDLASALALK